MKRYPFLVILLLLLRPATGIFAQPAYQKEIDDWHVGRIAALEAENGWLNLAGLFWLDEGRNNFGSDTNNKLVFPAGSIGAQAGYFEWKAKQVRLFVTGSDTIKVNGKPVSEAVIFNEDAASQPVVSAGNLKWTIIRRGEKVGVRLRDLKSPQLSAFKGIDRFPANAGWRIPATLKANMLPQTVAITNVLGQTNQEISPGKLFFYINKRPYVLDALEEDDKLFVIFGDASNSVSTYATGRFLLVEKPGTDGRTWIDFNKAYNPPCAFTPYATCPLPPKQNILPENITAGEKNYGQH